MYRVLVLSAFGNKRDLVDRYQKKPYVMSSNVPWKQKGRDALSQEEGVFLSHDRFFSRNHRTI